MYQSEELLKKVNEALDGLVYDRQPFSLYEPIQYVLAIGGKRVRPVLMLLTYDLYQDDPEREYKMDYAGYRVTFVVADGKVVVKKIEKI